jgi:ribosomal protein S18 acetylase RimI-like enzyme
MTPLDPSPGPAIPFEVRPAGLEDREQIAELISREPHVHKHLDWKGPLDWLGYSPFMVLEEGPRISGVLACPMDPESIAWLRLFVFASHLSAPAAWRPLWSAALKRLEAQGAGTAAAIAIQRWLDPILLGNGFKLINHIVLLELNTETPRADQTSTANLIRPMTPDDLPSVVEVDSSAFEPLWRNSLDALIHAFKLASYATVAEDHSGLLGYQLSTGGAFGTHLARLAVRPETQGRGLGAALVNDLIAHIPRVREARLSVNTQSNNTASLALYSRLGFQRTGERFPVFALDVKGMVSEQKNAGDLH